MKTLYIFFIATEFKTGKAIRLLTRGKYNHVAFSFEPSTKQMYAYSRYRYHEPFLSGFGIEYTDRYRWGGGTVDIKVCACEIPDEHYARIEEKIKKYTELKSQTRYNFIDLFAYPFHKHVDLELTHTCISFVLNMLEMRDIYTIGQLEKRLSGSVVYEGALDKFEGSASRSPVDFFERRKRLQVYAESTRVLCQQAKRFAALCVNFVLS